MKTFFVYLNTFVKSNKTNSSKNFCNIDYESIFFIVTIDFGEVKICTTECKEKCFQMMSLAYLHYSKASQNFLMLMIHLRKGLGG